MEYSNAAKTLMLDAISPSHLSMHNAIPSDAGSGEPTGGSPAYARVAATIAAASGTPPTRAMETADPDPEFDIPAGSDCVAVGFWTASTSGTFLGWAPAKGADVRGTARVLNSGDVLQCFAHGLSNGNMLQLKSIFGQAIPAGLSGSTLYFVVAASTDDFQVSATLGGAAVTITADGEVGFVRHLVESFVDQGKFQVNTAVLDLNG